MVRISSEVLCDKYSYKIFTFANQLSKSIFSVNNSLFSGQFTPFYHFIFFIANLFLKRKLFAIHIRCLTRSDENLNLIGVELCTGTRCRLVVNRTYEPSPTYDFQNLELRFRGPVVFCDATVLTGIGKAEVTDFQMLTSFQVAHAVVKLRLIIQTAVLNIDTGDECDILHIPKIYTLVLSFFKWTPKKLNLNSIRREVL